jgi:outer membrane autotransporter protein
MLRPKSVVCQSRVAAVVAPLALVLSMSISHQAMAACVLSGVGDTSSVWTCDGEDNTFTTNVDKDFGDGSANTGAAFDTDNTANGATGNKIIRAKGDTDGVVEITNDAKIRARVGTVTTDLDGNTIPVTGTVITNTNRDIAIYGVKGADSDNVEEFTFTNNGSIEVIHKGLGQAAGVFVQNDAEEATMVNNGSILVTRGDLSGISVNAGGAITATAAAGGSSGTLRIIAGIYNNEEEIRDHNVINNGEIIAHGPFSAGIFTRSNSFELVNYGTIAAYETQAGALVPASGNSAALVMWDGRLLKQMPDGEISSCASQPGGACTGREAGFGKSFVENNGEILGNVIVTGLNGQQVMGRIGAGGDTITLNGANGAIPNANVQGGMVDRRDSEIENNGTIIGNIYYGNGAHVLNNTEEGEIKGDIIVDMRRVTNYLDANNYGDTAARQINNQPYNVYVAGRTAALGEEEGGGDDDDDAEGGAPEIYTSDPGLTYAAAMANAVEKLVEDNPDRHFTFENAGVFEGDLSILTVNNTYTNAALLAANSSVTITAPTVDLKPHITGSGAGSSKDAPSEGSGYIDGRLFIGNGSMAGWDVTPTSSTISDDGAGGTTKTTVTPIIDHVVRSDEWFLVAEELYGNSLPGVEGDTVLVSWEIDKNSGGALVVGSTVADAATVAGLSAPGAATLNALMQGGNADTNALGGALQSLTDADDVRKAGEQLKPETNFATQQAAWTLSFLTGNSIDNRLNGVGATGASGPGFAQAAGVGMTQTASASPAPEGRMSLGLGTNDGRMNIGANDGRMDAGIYNEADPDLRQRDYRSGLWGQVFGAGLSQDERANVAGYNTNIYGAMAGVDNWIDARTRLGFAGGYGNTSIDTENPDTKKNQTEIDSYLGMIYGAYKGSGWYLSSRAGYSWHDYTTQRVVTVPVSATALGSHSGNQYTASAEVGTPLQYYGASFTPVASVTWNRLEQDGYQESSVVGLNVASQENDSLQSGLGAKTMIQVAPGTLIEGRAIWYHEFEDTNQQVTAAFGGAANFTAAGPSVGRDTAAVGVGMFAYTEAGVSVQLNYDALLRTDFIGHTGSGRVKVEF